MKKEHLLILSITLIFILIFLSISTKQTYEGKITKIDEQEKRTILNLEDYEENFISFDKIENIESCLSVKIQGRKEIYKNKQQIIIDKITCKN